MSSTTAVRGHVAPAAGVTLTRVITSEWIKLRSLRSTRYTLAASVGIVIGLGLLFAVFYVARWNLLSPADRASLNTTAISLRGVVLAQLALGTLGIMLITGEYATGMIRATVSAVPRRLPVLWAKLAVFAVVATVISAAATLIVFLAGQAIFAIQKPGASLADPGVLRAVIGAGLYLGLIGLLGMALGFIVRSTPAAITILFSILLILPTLSEVLPSNWSAHVTPYLPSDAGQAVMQLHPSPDSLAPWTGFALLAGYTAVAIVAGAIILRRRDA